MSAQASTPTGSWSMPGLGFDLTIDWQADALMPGIVAVVLTLNERSDDPQTSPQLVTQPRSATHEFTLGISSVSYPSRAQFVFLNSIIYVFLSPQLSTQQAQLGVEFPLSLSTFFRRAIASWDLLPTPEPPPEQAPPDDDDDGDCEPPAQTAQTAHRKFKQHKRRL